MNGRAGAWAAARAVGLVLFLAAAAAEATPPQDLDSDIAALLADGPPGIAIAIVEDGKTVLAKGYGVKRVGGAEPVTPATLFEIGSTTKAFTSAALAVLVDEGRLKWDDRVVDHMPEFQMYDPWVTREMQVRDLLTHRSGLGLGAGDLTIVPRTTHSRAEVMAALRHLKPEASFRSSFAYSNLMYIAAGQLIEKVSGVSWEQFVQSKLLTPAGMSATFASGPDRFASARGIDRAQPHARLGPPLRGFGALSVLDEARGLGPNVGPAGAMASNVDDMARWIAVQLARGKLPGGGKVWSEPRTAEMWTVVTPLPTPAPSGELADAAPRFAGYALGWQVRDYHGERVITHAGGTLGFLTRVVLMPERNVGFVMVQNSEDSEAIQSQMFRLLDHYAGRPPVDWKGRFKAQRQERLATARTSLEQPAGAGAGRRVPPSLAGAGYAGRYRDAWYGPVTVAAAGDRLTILFERTPGMEAELSHQSGDRFLARWKDASIEPAVVTFHLGADGKVRNATLAAYSPLADFSFDYHNLDLRPEREMP